MRLFITCDIFWESKVDKVLDRLDESGYVEHFEVQNYGSSMLGIVVVLMCQGAELELKRRIRFLKKDKTLYMDIMLDLKHFLVMSQKEREEVVIEKLISEIPAVINSYKLKDFDLQRFEGELQEWMNKILMPPDNTSE